VSVVFRFDLPHGRCVGVAVPAPLELLAPEEKTMALAMGEARRGTFAAGRVALRAALKDVGVDAAAAILPDDRGAPQVPAGARGSISHKRTLAVGLAAAGGEPIGVDLEAILPGKIDIARRVLTPREATALIGLPPETHARLVLLHLSLKEAIYKALDPFVRRYVSFQEVGLALHDDGTAAVSFALPEGPFAAEASWREISAPGPFFLTTASILRA
jgi:enterobactin synthetase component D